MSDDMKMIPGGITFGPAGDAPGSRWEAAVKARTAGNLRAREAKAAELERLRRRVKVLESRLARVLACSRRPEESGVWSRRKPR